VVVEAPAGFKPATNSLRVRPGQRLPLHFVLEARAAPAPVAAPVVAGTGRIVVDSTPYWTNVYLGKKLLGPTPVANAEVPAGTVTLRLLRSDTCKIDVTRTLVVPPGGVAKKAFEIEPKDARGSCQ
jgi:hypothetical protein